MIPSMIFSGSSTVPSALTPAPRCIVKENIQLVPPREDFIESRKTYASILKKDSVSTSTAIQKDKVSTYLQNLPEQTSGHTQEWFTIGRKGKPIQQSVPKVSKRQSKKFN